MTSSPAESTAKALPRPLADITERTAPRARCTRSLSALAADPAARHADAMEFVAEFDGAIDQIPLNEEEQAYLLLVSQRMATPSRGGMIVDSSTPVRSMSAVLAECARVASEALSA